MDTINLTPAQEQALRRSLEPTLSGQSVVGGLPLMLHRLRAARDRQTNASASITDSLSTPGPDTQFTNVTAIALQTLDSVATEISQAFHSVQSAEMRLHCLRDLAQKGPSYAAAMRQSLISLKPLAFMQDYLVQHSEDYQRIADAVKVRPRTTIRKLAKDITRELYPNAEDLDGMVSRVTAHQIERMESHDWPGEWTLDLFFNDLFTLGAFFSIIDVEDIRSLKPKGFSTIESLVLLAVCGHYVHLTPIGMMGAGVAVGAFEPLQYQDNKGRVLEMALDKPEEHHAPIH